MSNHYTPYDANPPYPAYSQPAAPVIDPFLASTFDFHTLASPTTEHPFTPEQQHGHAQLQAAWAAQARQHAASSITPPNGMVGQPHIHRTYSLPAGFHEAHVLPSTPMAEEPPSFPDGSATGLSSGVTASETSGGPAAVIEEDKRRRNTEASARFRIKKKEREEALSRNAAELSAKVTRLEARVEELERENGWLRGLIVGKGAAAEAIEKGKGNVKRAEKLRTDGVGTGGKVVSGGT